MNMVAQTCKVAGIGKYSIEVASNRATSLVMRFIPLTALLLVGSGIGFAQYSDTQPPQPAPPAVTYSTQVPTFGAGHDYIQMLGETVNPANGSVSFRLNVPVPKGRGPSPSFSLSYNSAGVWGATPYSPGSPTTPGAQTVGMIWSGNSPVAIEFPTQGNVFNGWTELVPSLSASRSYFTNFAGTATCFYSENYVFTDAKGQKHAFSNVIDDGIEGVDPTRCSDSYGTGQTYPGFAAVLNGNPPTVATSIDLKVNGLFVPGGETFITDAEGNTYAFTPFNNLAGPCFIASGADNLSSEQLCDANGTVFVLPDYVEDRNGNRLTASAWQGGADTLGRQALSIQHAITGNYTGQTTATVAGAAAPYQINYGPVGIGGGTTLNPPIRLINGPPLTQSNTSADYTCQGDNTGQASTVSALMNLTSAPISLALPDGTSYQFQYDPSSGLLNKLIYPNGAYVSYVWGLPGGVSDEAVFYWNVGQQGPFQDYNITWHKIGCTFRYALPVLLNRYVSFDGTNVAEEQDFSYTTTFNPPATDVLQGWESKTTNVVTKDLLKGTSYSTFYTYQRGITSPPSVTLGDAATSFMTSGPEAVEASVVVKDSTGNVVRTTNKTWVAGEFPFTTQTVLANQKTSEQDYGYSAYNDLVQLTEKDNYDFGAGANGPLISKTLINYAQFGPNPIAAGFIGTPSVTAPSSLLSFPSSITEYDGSGNRVAETDYGYDETGLTQVSATSHDDANYGPNSTASRANLTSITKRCFPNCADAKTTMTYDSTGQVLSVKDPNGQTTGATTLFSYADSFAPGTGQPTGNTNAFLTKITRPSVTGVAEISSAQYGFNDSLIYSVTDPNSQTTKFCYWVGGCSGNTKDPFNRLTEKQMPDGGDVKATYVDTGSSPKTTVTTAINASTSLVQTTVFDAMGHAIQSQTTDPQGTDSVDTVYDGLGRVYSVSNPYRSTSDPTYGLTTYTYDVLNRKVLQKQPDGSYLQWCYDGIPVNPKLAQQTVCTANQSSVPNATWVDSADEKGQHWQHVSDGLGRLVAAVEPNPNGNPNTLALKTAYTYDALNNLKTVAQNGTSGDIPRNRSFTYNSFSQFLTSSNPETGTICYGTGSAASCSGGYDGNGNLLTKTDARGVAISYRYDALNRLVQKGSPVLPAASTPNYSYSCYQYDATSVSGASSTGNFVGRLTNSWTQISSTPPSSFTCPSSPPSSILSRRSILAYDAMGRIQNEQQCTKTNCTTVVPFTPSYSYDLAGNVLTRSNGIGSVPITLTNSYDAVGRLATVTSNITQYPSSLFTASQSAASPGYSPAGGLMNATFGTGLNLVRTYDSRLRITGEIDTGNTVQPPTPGTATISITGTAQHQ